MVIGALVLLDEGMQVAVPRAMSVYTCRVCETGASVRAGPAPHLVFGGIAVPAVPWKEPDERVSRIRRNFDFEDGHMNLAEAERKEFLAAILREDNGWTEARIFAEGFDKHAHCAGPRDDRAGQRRRRLVEGLDVRPELPRDRGSVDHYFSDRKKWSRRADCHSA